MQLHERVEWDVGKARRNEAKHGVAFALAAAALLDERADATHVEIVDDRQDYGEDRWLTLAPVPGSSALLLVIVWTERGDTTRIISARRAKPAERKNCEHEIAQRFAP